MSFKFEELKVWQKSLELTLMIHDLTLRFPKDELYILTSQIKRAADSVSLNIAEGSTGQTDAEFNKFLGYALRSAIEVVSCLHIGLKRNIISKADFENNYNLASEIIKMIQALRKSLKQS
ncbi:MAG TPA: four helix bundle protein [Bacteroidales bacterium]